MSDNVLSVASRSPDVTPGEDLNPFHIAQQQFDHAARYIPDLKAGLIDFFKQPDRVITLGMMPLGVLPTALLIDYMGPQVGIGLLGAAMFLFMAYLYVTQKPLRKME